MSKKDDKMSLSEQDAAIRQLQKIFEILDSPNGTLEQFTRELAAWRMKYPLEKFSKYYYSAKKAYDENFLARWIGQWLAVLVMRAMETDKQKQKRLFDNLVESLDKAKDERAEVKVVFAWKAQLYQEGFSLNQFDKTLAKEVLKKLILPHKKLRRATQGERALTTIQLGSENKSATEIAEELRVWQNKYVYKDLSEPTQKKFKKMFAEILEVRDKKVLDQQAAVKEIKDYVSSMNPNENPEDRIASILSKCDYEHFDDYCKQEISELTAEAINLFDDTTINPSRISSAEEDLSGISTYMSPAERQAIKVLKYAPPKIEAYYVWACDNRNINFGSEAIKEIMLLYRKAGFPKSKLVSKSYNIPLLQANASSKEISRVMELTVFAIFSMLYNKERLSSTDKGKLSKAISMVIPVEDNVVNDNTSTMTESELEDPINNIQEAEAIVSTDNSIVEESGKEGQTIDNSVSLMVEDIFENPEATTYDLTTPEHSSVILNNSLEVIDDSGAVSEGSKSEIIINRNQRTPENMEAHEDIGAPEDIKEILEDTQTSKDMQTSEDNISYQIAIAEDNHTNTNSFDYTSEITDSYAIATLEDNDNTTKHHVEQKSFSEEVKFDSSLPEQNEITESTSDNLTTSNDHSNSLFPKAEEQVIEHNDLIIVGSLLGVMIPTYKAQLESYKELQKTDQ